MEQMADFAVMAPEDLNMSRQTFHMGNNSMQIDPDDVALILSMQQR